jgi:Zn-dependent peptidase ImmA (M78 family)/DNA-binding XRE family transcriptional regulator
MRASFQPARLKQARALRRLTLAELGEKIEVTRQSLSQFENAERSPAPETLDRLAVALGVPPAFFLRPVGELESSARSLVHYRSLRRTRDIVRERERSSALLDLGAALVDTLEQRIEFEYSQVPDLDLEDALKADDEAVEMLAQETRKALRIGEGPISDMTLLVENQAVPILYMSLPDGMDGLSAWYGSRPIIAVSSDAPRCRSRLNVAHEYGHLIMHRAVDGGELDIETFKHVEHQAWRFAGAFLMPAKSFLAEVYSVSLDALLALKKRWGVSVAAMVRRLSDLMVINDSQTKHLQIQISQRAWRKREPGDDEPREKAQLLSTAARFLEEQGELSLHALAEESKLPVEFVANALDVPREALLPPAPENVVQFRIRK